MLRTTITLTALSLATPALAHPGHIEAQGGHSHYLAVGAGVLALVVLAGALIKGWIKRDV